MDNNRLYWIFIVSLYKITKTSGVRRGLGGTLGGGGYVGGMGVLDEGT